METCEPVSNERIKTQNATKTKKKHELKVIIQLVDGNLKNINVLLRLSYFLAMIGKLYNNILVVDLLFKQDLILRNYFRN